MTQIRWQSLHEAVLEGWEATFGVAALAAIVVLVGYWATDGANVQRVGLNLPSVLFMYGIAATASGVVFGLTRPLRFRFWGRVLSGMMVGCAVGWALGLVMLPQGSFGEVAVVGSWYGVLVGGGWGAVWMRRPSERTP